MNNKEAQATAGRETALPTLPGREVFVTREKIYPWLYAAAILLGELLVVKDARAGLLVHMLILSVLLVQAAFSSSSSNRSRPGTAENEETGEGARKRMIAWHPGARFYLTLTLAPLIRILSLSLPLAVFPLVYWYAVVSLPLLVGAVAAASLSGYRPRELGLGWGNPFAQLLIGTLGVPLGLAEYFILHPQPLTPTADLAVILLPALILLVCTGFAEEFIFRGIMQKAAADLLGRKMSLVLVSFIFAILHITHLSAVDVFFVFGVACFFSTLVYRTGSLFGVTLAHGLTNITMYLFWPFIF